MPQVTTHSSFLIDVLVIKKPKLLLYSLLHWTSFGSTSVKEAWVGQRIWGECGGIHFILLCNFLLVFTYRLEQLVLISWIGYWRRLFCRTHWEQEAFPCLSWCWSCEDYNWQPSVWRSQGIVCFLSYTLLVLLFFVLSLRVLFSKFPCLHNSWVSKLLILVLISWTPNK